MTFQEILAEVKTLSREEQNQLVAALKDDLDATPPVSLTALGEFEIWSPEWGSSVEILTKMLEQNTDDSSALTDTLK